MYWGGYLRGGSSRGVELGLLLKAILDGTIFSDEKTADFLLLISEYFK